MRRRAVAGPGPDPVVVDARMREAFFQLETQRLRDDRERVDRQRVDAARILAESREAERRNHFAEAIVASMRRRQ